MKLILTGWRPEIRTISVMKLLAEKTDLGLKQSHAAVAALIEGTSIEVDGLDQDEALTLMVQIESLGAYCAIVDDEV